MAHAVLNALFTMLSVETPENIEANALERSLPVDEAREDNFATLLNAAAAAKYGAAY